MGGLERLSSKASMAGPGSRRPSKSMMVGSRTASKSGAQSMDVPDNGTKAIASGSEQDRAAFLMGLRAQSKEHNEEAEREARTCQLALKYKLSLSEAKRICNEFHAAQQNADGGLDRKDFDKVMCRIFDVDGVDNEVALKAYQAMKQGTDIELFLNWYVQNMFTQVASMNCSKDKRKSEALIYSIAKTHGVSAVAIDKIKSRFDHYDSNKSGEIDYNEFVSMFKKLLNAKAENELNPERLKRFWSEIDHDGDQGVDFGEFCAWYLKYFNVDEDDESSGGGALMQAFYNTFDPSKARHDAYMHGDEGADE
jgi:Ca2+-binding EF-hand superfamily protein